ncbi:MAG: nitroreductase family protein [Candidatus Omnitrophica bacterium]|nr:nitroreductase family protein [Candidatus Omnitrophota bacterium]
METIQTIKKRRSIRTFESRAVSKDIIKELLDCARFAPTARNIQAWQFIVITDKQTKKKISDLAPNGNFIKDAPVCIAIVSEDTKYYLEDGSAATQNLLLAAVDLGLAACWVAGDKKDYCVNVLDILKVPYKYKLVSMIALGYSKEKNEIAPKKSLDHLVHWERFK